MELTIIQNGALYAMQHGAPKEYRRVRRKPVGPDRMWALPALATSREKFTMSPISTGKTQPGPEIVEEQVTDAFPEYRAAA
jgi:hypothetical protein